MATRESIAIDLQEARNRASELENIASQLNTLAGTDMQNSFQTLSSGWSGDSANAFLKKGSDLQTDIKNQAANLNQIASTIRSVAQNIYNTELRNIEIAERRDY